MDIKTKFEDKSYMLFRRNIWLALLGLVMAIFLLPGCGSDSTPKGAASGKKEKAAASQKATIPQAALPMEVTGKPLKKEPQGAMVTDGKFPTGLSVAEAEKRMAEELKRTQDPNYEVLPGITKQALEAKAAAGQKIIESNRNPEIFPGITKQELEARIAAQRQKMESVKEPLPGMSAAEVKAKLETERLRREAPGQEVFPGVTKEELESKSRSQQK